MKRPFRVALIGRTDSRIETLLAGLPPAFELRSFVDGSAFEPCFSPELVAILPGAEVGAAPDGCPCVVLGPEELHLSPLELESRLLNAAGRPPLPTPLFRILGQSPAMAKVRGLLTKTARSPLPLLLTGESGTGKDLAAEVAHALSCRSGQAFVVVNCGAVPPTLAETEFFGCARGAFTGAENRTGFCHQAMGGTLFLDEVGETPLEIQAKLLRVLESRELRRVGSCRVEESDFRLICATNRNLAAEVKAGRFREDLYYRINVLPLKMPPLRDRKEDIPLLAGHFLNHDSSGLGRRVRIGSRALSQMMDYHWPGNLRQLRNVVLRAAVLHGEEEILPEHIEWET